MQTSAVKSPHRLSDYMPDLARALVRTIGVAPAQTESVTFVADFLKMLARAEKADPSVATVFPPDMKKMAREMRVLRLLANPVEVDGHVLSMRTIPSAHMYAKTKQIVIRRGTLDLSAYPPAGRAAAGRASEAPSPARVAPLDAALLARLEAVETALLMDGAPARLPAEFDARLRRFEKRVAQLEINMDRVREKAPFEPYKHPDLHARFLDEADA